jgi:hypothetical protein
LFIISLIEACTLGMHNSSSHGMHYYSLKRNIDKLFHDFSTFFWAPSGRQPFYQREEIQPVVTHMPSPNPSLVK